MRSKVSAWSDTEKGLAGRGELTATLTSHRALSCINDIVWGDLNRLMDNSQDRIGTRGD